jgi:hypothetical protein
VPRFDPAPQAPAPQPLAPRTGRETPAASTVAGQPDLTPRAASAWPDICDQFGLHLLVLAEQLRTSLDELEADEDDPERLQRLYQVDHAVTRMRRACRDLRTLADKSEEELAGFTTSLLDVIRMAASAIDRYTQVSIGRVTDLAVLGYAADDVGSLLAALLDNATRYSPGAVSVSGHLLQDGGVMFRIEDTGIGIGREQVAGLNDALAGPVPEVDERTGRHTGFPVVHRIARKHSIGVRLASRPMPSSGTVAMVTLPPHLLCEVPAEEVQHWPGPGQEAAERGAAVSDMPRRDRPPAQTAHTAQTAPLGAQWATAAELREVQEPEPLRLSGDLPRRERASLRGDEPRPRETTERSAQQQSAARRAFADELTAFAAGAGDTAIEENNHA